MKTSRVEHQNQLYQLDKATMAHWRRAIVLRAPDNGAEWQLLASTELLVQFTVSLEGVFSQEPPVDAALDECVSALQALGYCVWSIDEAIQSIGQDSEDAGELVVLLERWFFLKKS